MGQAIDLFNGKYVSLDANLFIYLMEKNKKYLPPAKTIFEKIQKGQAYGVTSSIVYAEILSKPMQERNQTLVDMYRVFLSTFPNLYIKDVDKNVSIIAAELRANYGLKTPDAIYLATGVVEKADFFITNDLKLKNVKEINVITLDEML
ncbi:MAG: type II toxin-antitoxin system VapC family toxin [Thermoanaerobacter sp.]|uniref:type II toxin-antitoxin system VapC family toxin n=1 Tax=Thermoanaerobacter sp. TaxID=1755 RepID=UPI003463F0FE